MRYALDTNAIVAALNGVPSVTAKLAALDAPNILLPAPAIAELYFGAVRRGACARISLEWIG